MTIAAPRPLVDRLGRPMVAPAVRFWRHVDQSAGLFGCWLWTGATNGIGYGQFPYDGGRLAHRFSYELNVGPIPEGKKLDHLCRTTLCVNPVHLEPVTQRENILRGMTPTAIRVREGRCRAGHPYNEQNTYEANGHRQCRICARDGARERRAARSAA